MRPTIEIKRVDAYECLACGERVSDPDRRVCASCGGELWNLGHDRDL